MEEFLFSFILLNQAGNLFRCQGDVGSAKQRVAHRHRLGAAPNQLTGIIGRDAPMAMIGMRSSCCAGHGRAGRASLQAWWPRQKKAPNADVVGVLFHFDGIRR